MQRVLWIGVFIVTSAIICRGQYEDGCAMLVDADDASASYAPCGNESSPCISISDALQSANFSACYPVYIDVEPRLLPNGTYNESFSFVIPGARSVIIRGRDSKTFKLAAYSSSRVKLECSVGSFVTLGGFSISGRTATSNDKPLIEVDGPCDVTIGNFSLTAIQYDSSPVVYINGAERAVVRAAWIYDIAPAVQYFQVGEWSLIDVALCSTRNSSLVAEDFVIEDVLVFSYPVGLSSPHYSGIMAVSHSIADLTASSDLVFENLTIRNVSKQLNSSNDADQAFAFHILVDEATTKHLIRFQDATVSDIGGISLFWVEGTVLENVTTETVPPLQVYISDFKVFQSSLSSILSFFAWGGSPTGNSSGMLLVQTVMDQVEYHVINSGWQENGEPLDSNRGALVSSYMHCYGIASFDASRVDVVGDGSLPVTEEENHILRSLFSFVRSSAVPQISIRDSSFSHLRQQVVSLQPDRWTEKSNYFGGCGSLNVESVTADHLCLTGAAFAFEWACCIVQVTNVSASNFTGIRSDGLLSVSLSSQGDEDAVATSYPTQVLVSNVNIRNFTEAMASRALCTPIQVLHRLEKHLDLSVVITNSTFSEIMVPSRLNSGAVYVRSFSSGGNVSTQSVRLENCTFERTIGQTGGAFAVQSLSSIMVEVKGCEFRNNTAVTGKGGAISVLSTFNPPPLGDFDYKGGDNPFVSIDKSLFLGNFAEEGGAIGVGYQWLGVNVTECEFIENSAKATCGAISMASNALSTSSYLVNNTFVDNDAGLDLSDVYFSLLFIGAEEELMRKLFIGNNVFISHSTQTLSRLTTEGGGIVRIGPTSVYCARGSNLYKENEDFAKFSDVFGCSSCEKGSFSLEGGHSEDMQSYDNSGSVCYPCPDACTCAGGDKVKPDVGRWVNVNVSQISDASQVGIVKAYVCPSGFCCEDSECSMGGEQCQDSRTGVWCSECPEGKSHTADGVCVDNADCSFTRFFFGSFLKGIGSTLLILVSPGSSGLFKVSAFFFQMLPIVTVAAVQQTEFVPNFWASLGSGGSRVANLDVFSGSCAWKNVKMTEAIALDLLGPVLCFYILFSIWFHHFFLFGIPSAIVWKIVRTFVWGLRRKLFGLAGNPLDNGAPIKGEEDEGDISSTVDSDDIHEDVELLEINKDPEISKDPEVPGDECEGSPTHNDGDSSRVTAVLNKLAPAKTYAKEKLKVKGRFPPWVIWKWHWFHSRRYVIAFGTIFLLGYRTTLSTFIRLAHCVDYDDGTTRVYEAGGEKCNAWQSVVIWPFIVIFLIPFPIYLLIYRWSVRSWHHARIVDVSWKHKAFLDLLEASYRKGLGWYESAMIVRRIFLLFGGILISNLYDRAIYLTIVLVLSLAMDLLLDPFVDRTAGVLNVVSLGFLSVLSLVNLREATLMSEGVSIGDRLRLSSVLTVTFVALFVVLLVQLAVVMYCHKIASNPAGLVYRRRKTLLKLAGKGILNISEKYDGVKDGFGSEQSPDLDEVVTRSTYEDE